jgi:iron complex transport system permease protein
LGVALALVVMATVVPTGASALVAGLGLSTMAFAGALVGVLLSLALGGGPRRPMTLLVAGIAVGVVLGAAREALTLVTPQALRAMQGFMLGSVAFIDVGGVVQLGVAVLVVGVAVAWLASSLDAMVLGDDTARSLGVSVHQVRGAAIGLMALATGVAVAQAGLIAFVGLAAPHMARRLGQVRHRSHLPMAAAMGGLLLLLADLLARGVTPPLEWPVGLVTALIGGVYLLLVLRRGVAS